MYTPCGFAAAADGLQPWGNPETRDETVQNNEIDSVQKVFAFRGAGIVAAYIIRGAAANKDRTFDLALALKSMLFEWRNKPIADVGLFLKQLSVGLEHYIFSAKKKSRIKDFPESFVDFIGYIGEDQFWIELSFHAPRDGLLSTLTPRDAWPGDCIVSGSLIIRDLIFQRHPRFAHFCDPFSYKRSLGHAANYINGYVEACCSQAARDVDPECEAFGGHIHVATVDRTNGFRWVKPPLADDSPTPAIYFTACTKR
jgi:hypothetical protein